MPTGVRLVGAPTAAGAARDLALDLVAALATAGAASIHFDEWSWCAQELLDQCTHFTKGWEL